MASDHLVIGSAIDDLFAGEQLDSNPAGASAVVLNPDGGPGQPGGNDTLVGYGAFNLLARLDLMQGGTVDSGEIFQQMIDDGNLITWSNQVPT